VSFISYEINFWIFEGLRADSLEQLRQPVRLARNIGK
jgi:hypothetical protein